MRYFLWQRLNGQCIIIGLVLAFLFCCPGESAAGPLVFDARNINTKASPTPELKLYIGCIAGREDIVEKALLEGANLNTQFIFPNPIDETHIMQMPALSLSVMLGHKDVVNQMFQHAKVFKKNLKINAKDGKGNTALLHAVGEMRRDVRDEIVKILLAHTPSLVHKDEFGKTAEDIAKTHKDKKTYNMIIAYKKELEVLFKEIDDLLNQGFLKQ